MGKSIDNESGPSSGLMNTVINDILYSSNHDYTYNNRSISIQ